MLDLTRTSAVILDVDGTIAGADHQVTQRTLDAMSALESRGIPVVLATGRSRRNVVDIAVAAGLRTPQVSCNGAVVTDPQSGRDLRVKRMSDHDIASMITLHRRTGLALTWWTPGDIYVTSEPLRQILVAFGDNGVQLATEDEIEPASVIKMMVFGTRSELDAIETEVAQLAPRAMRSMDEFWELSDPDASKWSGISYVFESIGVDPRFAVGLGDGGNDIVWMEQIGTPVAMGNARPEVIAATKAVVGHHGAEGAAEFLEEVLAQLPASTIAAGVDANSSQQTGISRSESSSEH
ncbi:MAG: HAD family hydrolase [Nakamurella sp.]